MLYGTIKEWNFPNAGPTVTVVILFEPTFSWMFPVTVLTKVVYWDFDVSNSFKKEFKFNIMPNGKIAKTLLLTHLLFFPNQTLYEYSTWEVSQKLHIEILKFQI